MTTNQTGAVRDSKHDRRRARDERGLASAVQAARTDRLPPAPRERRPLLAALAVLLIVGGAATAGLLALRADDRTQVLVARTDIPAGTRITDELLATTPVASEGTLLVPADQAASVYGRYTRVAVTAGQLLDTSMVTRSAPLGEGQVAVGASLGAGRTPASGLEPGDVVQLVRTGDTAGEVLVPDARVSSVRSDETAAGATTVTFIVDEADGAQIATVAASDSLAAVLVQRGGEPAGDD